jgi:outer membrane lipoprotein carrier protein
LAVAFGDDPIAEAVAGLQRRYAAVESVSAEFRQSFRAPGIDQVESGHLLMKKPGLMRWEYRTPEAKLFIADGKDTYLYTPEDRQVLVSRLSAAELHGTPLQFLLGQGDILRSFLPSKETEFRASFEGSVLLRLTPRSPEPDYAFLVLECNSATHDLRRIVIRELGGNTSEFVFSALETNLKVDRKQFQFKIPKGVEVVHLDEK